MIKRGVGFGSRKYVSSRIGFLICFGISVPFVVFGGIGSASAAWVLDTQTGYIQNHGNQINFTVTADPAGPPYPTIIATSKDSSGTTICADTLVTGYDSKLKNVFVKGADGTPTFLMLSTTALDCSGSNLDPPVLKTAGATQVTLRYNNDPTTDKTIQIDGDAAWPYGTSKKSTDQPVSNAVLNCSGGSRGGAQGDYICNEWKDTGHGLDIPYPDGSNTGHFVWPCTSTDASEPFKSGIDYPCPSSATKDVYVEVDAIEGHWPSIEALKFVRNAFADHRINLHFQLSDQMPHFVTSNTPVTSFTGPNNGNDLTQFTILKSYYFGLACERAKNCAANWSYCSVPSSSTCVTDILTAKKQVFHYMLFGQQQPSPYQQSSGKSEVVSVATFGGTNDAYISLGAFSYARGSVDQQAGTIMHELGHMLDLSHAGPYSVASDTTVNCKPNYLSVMNYAYQFKDLTNPHPRPYDYSHESVAPVVGEYTDYHVVEGNPLVESAITGTDTTKWAIFGLATGAPSLPTPGTHPDWDNDLPGGVELVLEDAETGTIPILNSWSGIINTPGGPGANVPISCGTDSTLRTLHTWDDWGNLKYDMTVGSSFLDGAGGP